MSIFFKRFITVGVVGSPIFVLGVNHSEEYRMVEAIKNGKMRPVLTKNYNSRFSQFPKDSILRGINYSSKPSIGLIGPDGSGKSSELKMFACDPCNKNIVYCKLDGKFSSDLNHAMWDAMRSSIFQLPGFLSRIRFSSYDANEHIIGNIFRKVVEDTKDLVNVVIDVDVGKTIPYPNYFDPEKFISHIDYLVAHGTVQCLFAMSDDIAPPLLNHNENVQYLFTGELSKELSIEYVKHMVKTTLQSNSDAATKSSFFVEVLLLHSLNQFMDVLPRTFTNLQKLVNAEDKMMFAFSEYAAEAAKVQQSLTCFPYYQAQPVSRLYRVALTRSIRTADCHVIGRLTTKQFLEHFVKTGVFQEEPTSEEYKFKFDATRNAAKSLVKRKKGWFW